MLNLKYLQNYELFSRKAWNKVITLWRAVCAMTDHLYCWHSQGSQRGSFALYQGRTEKKDCHSQMIVQSRKPTCGCQLLSIQLNGAWVLSWWQVWDLGFSFFLHSNSALNQSLGVSKTFWKILKFCKRFWLLELENFDEKQTAQLFSALHFASI